MCLFSRENRSKDAGAPASGATKRWMLCLLGIVLLGFNLASWGGCKSSANDQSDSEYTSDDEDEDEDEDGPRQASRQVYNNNRQAIAQEVTTYGSMVIQWYKTPVSQGGAGQELPAENAAGIIAQCIGFGPNANSKQMTENGSFKVGYVSAPYTVEIWGMGNEWRKEGYNLVKARIDLRSSQISTMNLTDQDGLFETQD